jgi:hypothetical protein
MHKWENYLHPGFGGSHFLAWQEAFHW